MTRLPFFSTTSKLQMPRRHFQHYIPRLILKNFAYDDTRIWTYSHSDGLQQKRIGSVFGKRHLYSMKTIDQTNPKSHSFELSEFEQSIQKDPRPYETSIINRIETATDPIIQHMIEQVKHRRQPIRNFEDVCTLQEFLYLTARRTPESQEQVFRCEYTKLEDLAFEMLKTQIADDQEFSFTSSNEMYLKVPVAKRIRNLVRENSLARFAAGVDRLADVRNFCENTELQILYCHNTAKRFVIGSYGYAIVTLTSRKGGFTRSAVFPISSEIAIRIITNPQQGYALSPIFPFPYPSDKRRHRRAKPYDSWTFKGVGPKI